MPRLAAYWRHKLKLFFEGRDPQMSEASRQRWLHVHNRLEELRAKHGEPEAEQPQAVDLPPTWGDLGSLAERTLSEGVYLDLIKQHRRAC